MSKTMNKHELQYCTPRKALLAVVTALKNFHHYLLGQKVKLRSDNSAVSWKPPQDRSSVGFSILKRTNSSLKNRPWRAHGNSDALSRVPCKVCQRQEQNEIKDTDEHNPDLNSEEIGSDSKPTTELSPAVTRGQQQNEATAQLKLNQFLLEDWEPSTVRQNQLTDPVISPIMVAVESQSRTEWKKISETHLTY